MEPFAGHTGGIRTLAVTADGVRIISGGEDSTVRVWDLLSGKQETVLTGHGCPVRAVGVAGDVLVTCDETATVWKWDLLTGKGRDSGLLHRRAVSAAAVAPAASRFATGWANGDVSRWELGSMSPERMPGERPWVRSLAITPDATVVVAGLEGGGAHVWRPEGGAVRKLGSGVVYAVAVREDEVLTGTAGGVVELWERGTRLVEFTGHTGGVSTVGFSTEFVVAGGFDGTILVWERTRPDEPTVLNGHIGGVRALAPIPENGHFVSSGDDGTIRIWDHRAGMQIAGTGFAAPAPPQPRAGVTSDEESARDLLGFRGDVRTLATVIADRATEPPLCVALLGPWGSGKSSFMRQLQNRVDKLADLSRNNPERSVFAATVRQIRFNAWHYNDDQLWVGLVEHLFQNLVADDSADLTEVRDELRTRLHDMETLQDNVARSSVTRHLRLLVSGVNASVRRRRRAALVSGVLLTVLGGVVAVASHNAILAAAGALVAVAAVLTPAIAFAGTVLSPLSAVSGALRGKAQERRDELDREIRETRERLSQLDAAQRLGRLIDQARSGRYEQYRGLLGRVHEDLRTLNDDMRAVQTEWQLAGSQGPPPLERVVLYIDDLDRCSPRKVIDVLAAVHLLLALPMFVVVVAVDPRWLHKCLHDAGLSPEYLDKIFQVVFALRPMGKGADALIDALLPEVAVAPAASEQTEPPEESPAEESREAPANALVLDVEAPVVFDLKPGRLVLRKDERDFIHELGPLLATPRAVKKLVNLYRLVRIGIRDDELDDFPYRTVLVLLSMVVADPGHACEVFESISKAGPIPPEWRHYIADDIASYQQWVGTVARFSFETHHLVRP